MRNLISARKIKELIVVIGSLVFIFWIDLNSSSEISLTPLYLLPIVIALFRLGRLPAYLLCMLSSLCFLISELATRNYILAWAPYQAALSRALIYIVITYLLAAFRQSQRIANERLQRLQQILPICPECGKILCKDGSWQRLEKLLSDPGIYAIDKCLDCCDRGNQEKANRS